MAYVHGLYSSGILPVNAHAEVNILHLIKIDSFIFYSSTTRLSNDIHYNYYLRYILLHLFQHFIFYHFISIIGRFTANRKYQ